MRIKSLILCFLCLVLFSCKKDLLHWQSVERIETNTNNRLNKIVLHPDGTGVIAGGNKFAKADLLLTRDNGRTWENLPDPGAGKGLYGAARSPNGNYYMCGIDGKIVYGTPDDDWKYVKLPFWNFYVDLDFGSAEKGVLISTLVSREGTVAFIDAAGNYSGGQVFPFGLNDVEMVDGATGYISGYGVVMKTVDSGHTWEWLAVENDNFTALHTRGQTEVWTCGYNGSIFSSVDGGNTWKRLRNGNDITIPRYRLLDILFVDAQHGFAVGEEGLFIYTDDGGEHWMEFDRFTEGALRSLALSNDGSIMVCGDNGGLFRVVPEYLK